MRPRGRVVLVGMPAKVKLELTTLWHRETQLVGAYAYGTETLPDGSRRRTFDLAFELAAAAELGKLLTQTYALSDYHDAIEHAAAAGRRGAVKIAFDLRRRRSADEPEDLLMPRPGFVLDVDRSTPPTLFWRGEGFSLEKAAGRSEPDHLSARTVGTARRRRRSHPRRPAEPARLRPAARPVVPGDEADHRLRRRQPVAAEDAQARHPPAHHRERSSTSLPPPGSTMST